MDFVINIKRCVTVQLISLIAILFVHPVWAEQARLDTKDIESFTEKSSNIGQSADELSQKAKRQKDQSGRGGHLYKIIPFTEGDQLCKDENTLVQECRQSLKPYVSLLEECEITRSWMKETLQIVEKILRTLESDPVASRQWQKSLKGQLIQLEALKAQLIQEGELPLSSRKGVFSRIRPVRYDRTVVTSTDTAGFKNYIVPDNSAKSGAVGTVTGSSQKNNASQASQSRLLERYTLQNRMEIIESLKYALDRRIYFWSLAANYYEHKKYGKLATPIEMPLSEIVKLKELTEEVRRFFGVDQTGQGWRNGFEIDLLYTDLMNIEAMRTNSQVFVPVSAKMSVEEVKERRLQMLEDQIVFLQDRINSICYKIVSTPMNSDQLRIFNEKPITDWFRFLQQYSSDPADAQDLLWAFEAYERNAGADRATDLYRTAYRMKSSRSEVCRKFGEAINVIYDNPNTKVYISEALINRLLPIHDPEFDVVQETVLNNPVAGQRRTDIQVLMKLVPSPDSLLMNLWIRGQMVASTTSNVFPAKMYNESHATYLGRKEIEWKKYGIVHKPTEVMVNNTNELSDVRTGIDFVPILSDLVRGVAKGQYEMKQADIERATKIKIAREVRHRVDQESGGRFDALNKRLAERFFGHFEKLGLDLNIQNARTTEEWLLASMRLESERSLGSQTMEPATLPGAFADLKVHESSINTFLSRLDLREKTFDAKELTAYLDRQLDTQIFQRMTSNGRENGLRFSFAHADPVSVRFFENRIQLKFFFDSIELNNQVWNDVAITVSYRPDNDTSGRAILSRDGIIELEGPINIRAQIPLRAIFTKMFPSSRAIPLEPALFRTDSRFAGLSTGLCRVSRGWFALSVVQSQAPVYEYQK